MTNIASSFRTGPLTNLEVKEAIRSKANPLSSGYKDESNHKPTELGTVEFASLEEFEKLTENHAWVIEVRQDDNPAVSTKIWYRLSRFLKVFSIRSGRLLCHEYLQ